MRLSELKSSIGKDPNELQKALEAYHEEDVASVVVDLELDEIASLLRAMPEDIAANVLERFPEELRESVFKMLHPTEGANLLTEMAPDDRVDLLQTLDDGLAKSLLEHLDKLEPEIASETRSLGAFAEHTAGGLMTTDFVTLAPESTVADALALVRRKSKEIETPYYVFVTAYEEKLLGVASLRELIVAEPHQLLSEVMTGNVVKVLHSADQEEVAKTMAKYDFHAVPVVDEHDKLLGVVTVDDAVDVVIEEATEDAHKMGGVSPISERYFDTSTFLLFKSRVTWLLLLFFAGFLTAEVISFFQHDLTSLIQLASFMPLIISAGGNAGSQSASLLIRAIATGEATPSDWSKVLTRELTQGLMLGGVLALCGFFRAYLWGGGTDPFVLALTVCASLLFVVLAGSLVGALMPLLIRRLGLDPAVSSAPFIASLIDVLGLVIYLGLARFLLLPNS